MSLLRRSLPVLFASTLALAAVPARAQAPAPNDAPAVTKVEPPNWWVGHSINPVRLLVRGKNLSGARVESARPGVRFGRATVNASGTYLFVDATIEKAARPGPAALRIATAAGKTEAPFEVLARPARAGRFQGFSSDDVVYLVMPDRFANGDPANDKGLPGSEGLLDRSKPRYYHGGDLQGVIERLPYLKDLGVTAIWLNPWYDNANRLNEKETYGGQPITDYHGYGAVDLYGVDEHLGTLATVQKLVESAHALGIKVIQDQVANHTGPYHPWVEDPPSPTWYHGTAAKHLNETWQIWTLADPYAGESLRRPVLDGWFIDILPDLNQEDPEVSRYLIQNALWWVGIAGLDGIRQDTWPYVPRTFWRDWVAALKREHPSLTAVGEVWDSNLPLVAFFQGGARPYDGVDSGVDSLFDFPLFYAIRRAFAEGKPVREVPMLLAQDRVYAHPERLVTFLGLHDVPRFLSEPGATLAGLELAYTFLLTTRGIPVVYYGDEVGMTGGADPENRRDFPGGWREDARNAFQPSGRLPEQQRLFEHVRLLTRLRAESPALRRGTTQHLLAEEQSYAYARRAGSETVLVALNNATTPASLRIPVGALGLKSGAGLVDRLGRCPPARVENGEVVVTLPARSGSVFTAR